MKHFVQYIAKSEIAAIVKLWKIFLTFPDPKNTCQIIDLYSYFPGGGLVVSLS